MSWFVQAQLSEMLTIYRSLEPRPSSQQCGAGSKDGEASRPATINNHLIHYNRFDPITVSKIFILGQSEVHSTLARYIDEENIPRKYGGKLDWEWGSLPNLEPAIANALHWDSPSKDGRGGRAFPIGPVKFEEDKNGDLVAYAAGSENGQRRRTKVATVPMKKNLDVGGVGSKKPNLNREKTDPSGWHTHPAAGQESMPHSGHTPPNGSPTIHPMVGATRDPAAGQEVSSDPDHPRGGTSLGKFEQQNHTHARGQFAEGTPVTIDQGYGDKHTTSEPATIGQAAKDVEVPYREAPQDTSYLGQAKAALNSAVVAAEGAEEAVLEKLGYGHKQEEKPVEEKPHAAPNDPRVAQMETKDVEAFLRSKYADYDRPGHHR